MSLNRVTLVGRLTRDPEARTTQTGKSLVNFGLAVRKRMKPQEGEPDADFFNIKAWGQTADYAKNYLTKGVTVAVDGRLETRKYTDSNGNNRESVEIVADNLYQVGGGPREGGSGGGGQMGGSTGGGRSSAPADDSYDPFGDE